MDGITERIERAQRGDKGERDRLVVDNMPLVWSMVGRFSSSGKDKEELFQIGMIGLMQAIDRTLFHLCGSPDLRGNPPFFAG